MTTPLTLIVDLTAKPGLGDTLGAGLRAMIAPTLSEEGCLGYVVYRNNADPDHWIVHETWASAAALDHHFAQPYTTALFAQAPELVAKEPVMTFATSVGPSD
ncbi:putative quinol monooxygenase [Methylobacterium aquaticum]|uniref:putative quinol monooxygenase n=1 Tax=Methylobacterium aquaticum TaxID=270351 RepID=UPI003D16CD4E